MPLLKKYFYDGYLFDAYMAKHDVEQFLIDNKESIEKLDSEYLKKMNHHKEYQLKNKSLGNE